MDEIKRTMRVSVSYLPPHPFHNILCAVDFPRNRDLSLFCACHKSGHVIGSVPRSYRTYARTTRRNFEARCVVHENRTGRLPVPGPSSNAVQCMHAVRCMYVFSVWPWFIQRVIWVHRSNGGWFPCSGKWDTAKLDLKTMPVLQNE